MAVEVGQRAVLSSAVYSDQIRDDGFAIVGEVVSPETIDRLRTAISSLPEGEEIRRRTNVFGVRNLLDVSSEVRKLAAAPEIRGLVTPVLGQQCFAVRATFFDKVPDANWKLRWHQDSAISVKKRVEIPGFTAWSEKAGVMQVRPPEEVLLEMLAVRVHLDECSERNGPLRVLSGSHTRRWPLDEIPDCKSKFREVVCEVDEGGILAMRPLLLHASSSSEVPAHRRVIHIEYANRELPGALEWQQRITA